MPAWIMVDERGVPVDANMFALLDGFRDLGEEVRFYRRNDWLKDLIPATPHDIAVGYVEVARHQFRRMGVPQPADLDYPAPLTAFLGRTVARSTVGAVRQRNLGAHEGAVFVKPVRHKQFPGFVCRTQGDLLRFAAADGADQVWVSDLIDLRSEHRCYVHLHEVIDVRRYAGNFRAVPDWSVIDRMIAVTRDEPLPIACALDVGVTGDGRTVLIEANDGFAMGNYGLSARRYAELLRDRWNQVVGRR